MMLKHTTEVYVRGSIYDIKWLDFKTYVRLVVYKDGNKIGYRDLQVSVDKSPRVVSYLIKRMVGGYDPVGYMNKKQQNMLNKVRLGVWLDSLGYKR